ncbi:sel1 repeat family protein, partial [Pseudomonas sp. Y39-6]
PSEALIQQLAKAKLLEPATGRPTPDSPAFIKASYPEPTCTSGQACPQTGYWRAFSLSRDVYARLSDGVIRRFEKNEIMPTLQVESHKPRFLLPDIITVNEESIEWRLLG